MHMSMIMSAEKPNFRRVFSDSWRIISSNSLHFLALSALFIFPTSLFSAIYSSTTPPAAPSHYGRRLLSMHQDSQIPPFDKSQLLYFLTLFLLNLCSLSSITHSIYHGFHNKPFTLSSSLKSIISSFFPLLATKLAYAVLMLAVTFFLGFLTAFFSLGLVLLGFEMKPDSPNLMVFGFVIMAVFVALFVYLKVEWLLVDASVVVESKFGFSPFGRSSKLVKGAKGIALSILLVFGGLHMMVWALYSSLGSRIGNGGGCVVVGVVAAVASSLVSVLSVGAHTVFFVYCRAFNEDDQLVVPNPTYDKLGEVYVPLPTDVEIDV